MSKMAYEIYTNEMLGVTVAKMSRTDFLHEVFNTAMRKLLKQTKNTRLDTGDWCSNFSDFVVTYFEKWSRKYKFEKNVVVRARCNFEDGDVYDETIGRYIVEDRMDMKITEYATQFLADFTSDLDNFVREMIERCDRLWEFIDHTEAHMRDLTGAESCNSCEIEI